MHETRAEDEMLHAIAREAEENVTRENVADAAGAEAIVPQPVATVSARFNGPPAMGNGGFTAGMLSRFFAGPVEVTLRRPVPLDRPLSVDEKPEFVGLWHEYALIASARHATADVSPPEPVTFEQARRASRASSLYESHPFPGCFVCGTERGDGLGIYPGAVAGREGIVAAPWVPREEFAEDGVIAPEYVWGALDCPGGIALGYYDPRPMVLGRITADVRADVLPGERYVAVGWPIRVEGRKQFAGTALFTARGELVASAESTWFNL
jgi:hypothetical protein